MSEHASAKIESWVLGALMDADGPLLRSRASDLLAATGITAEDFTTQPHAVAFKAIAVLAERGRPTDAQSVFAICRGTSQLEDAFEGMRTLQASNSSNREALLGHAEELRRLTLLRRLVAFHAEQLAKLERADANPTQSAAAIEAFAHTFAATTQEDETGDQDMYEIIEDWDAFAQGTRLPYLGTGIQILDDAIQGFVPNLNVIGGMPSIGKSAVVAEMIMSWLEGGLKVGLFGLEDATKWLSKRHLSRRMGISVGDVGAIRLSEHQQERLAVSANDITQLTRNMLVYRRAGIDPATLVQKCKHWILNKGVKAIVIDHGGEVAHENRTARDRHDLAVASTYRELRNVAVNHKTPIIVLCHFNRDTEKDLGGVPTMQSFAETEYIARMARVALSLWQKPGEREMRCTVLKRTEGERNITVAIDRDAKHALVRRVGGRTVDTDAERDAERQAKQGGHGWKRQAQT